MVTKRIVSKGAKVGNLYRITITTGGGSPNATATVIHGSTTHHMSGSGVIRYSFTWTGSAIVKYYDGTNNFDYIGGEYHNGSSYISDWLKGPDPPNETYWIDMVSSPETQPRYLERLTQLSTNTRIITSSSDKSL
jgi:hypothetical protein